MKTRILHTKFWTDSYVRRLKPNEKLFYFYLIANEFVNIIDIYELPLDIASIQTAIPMEEIEHIKNKLKADGKIDFIDEWIYLKNAEKYAYYKGIKNNHLKLRLLIEMSNETFTYFKDKVEVLIKGIVEETDLNKVEDKEFLSLLARVINRGIDRGMGILPINQKPETRNHIREIVTKVDIINNQEIDIDEIAAGIEKIKSAAKN